MMKCQIHRGLGASGVKPEGQGAGETRLHPLCVWCSSQFVPEGEALDVPDALGPRRSGGAEADEGAQHLSRAPVGGRGVVGGRGIHRCRPGRCDPGLTRQGLDVELRQFPQGWRATLYQTGTAHVLVIASAWESTPRDAAQGPCCHARPERAPRALALSRDLRRGDPRERRPARPRGDRPSPARPHVLKIQDQVEDVEADAE